MAARTAPAEMTAGLAAAAAREAAAADASDGVARMWLRRRGDSLPAAESFLVAAPAGAQEHEAERRAIEAAGMIKVRMAADDT